MGFAENFRKAQDLTIQYFTAHAHGHYMDFIMHDYCHMCWETYEPAFKKAFGPERITDEIQQSLFMLAHGLSTAYYTFKRMNPNATFHAMMEFLLEFIDVQFTDMDNWENELFAPYSDTGSTTSDAQEPTNPVGTNPPNRPSSDA